MLQGLSYLSLSAVMEPMEGNKRLGLVAHCPTMQNFDRQIPLRLNYVGIYNNQPTLNEISFKFTSQKVQVDPEEARTRAEQKLTPGDIELYAEHMYDEFYSIEYSSKGRPFGSRRLPEGLSIEMASKKLACYFFEGRENISVYELRIPFSQRVLRLPVGLKFKISKFDIERNEIERLEPLIHPSSLPLKVLQTECWYQEYYENTVVSTAKTFIFGGYERYPKDAIIQILMKVENQHVKVAAVRFMEAEFTDIVTKLRENGREVGSTMTIPMIDEDDVEKMMKHLKKTFKGSWVTCEEVEGILLPTPVLSISLNEMSEIVIYGVMERFEHIKIQIVPIGSSIPVPKKKFIDFLGF